MVKYKKQTCHGYTLYKVGTLAYSAIDSAQQPRISIDTSHEGAQLSSTRPTSTKDRCPCGWPTKARRPLGTRAVCAAKKTLAPTSQRRSASVSRSRGRPATAAAPRSRRFASSAPSATGGRALRREGGGIWNRFAAAPGTPASSACSSVNELLAPRSPPTSSSRSALDTSCVVMRAVSASGSSRQAAPPSSPPPSSPPPSSPS